MSQPERLNTVMNKLKAEVLATAAAVSAQLKSNPLGVVPM